MTPRRADLHQRRERVDGVGRERLLVAQPGFPPSSVVQLLIHADVVEQRVGEFQQPGRLGPAQVEHVESQPDGPLDETERHAVLAARPELAGRRVLHLRERVVAFDVDEVIEHWAVATAPLAVEFQWRGRGEGADQQTDAEPERKS